MFLAQCLVFTLFGVWSILGHHGDHHHHQHHHHHGHSNDPCPASESLRRTTHNVCHGYSDGSDAQAKQFIACAQTSKYKLYDGLESCGHHLNLTFTMTNLTEARDTICSLHDGVHQGTHEPWKESFPLFDCLIDFYATKVDCNTTGCSAKLYAVDDVNYDVLNCYQTVYGKFPEKFDCDD